MNVNPIFCSFFIQFQGSNCVCALFVYKEKNTKEIYCKKRLRATTSVLYIKDFPLLFFPVFWCCVYSMLQKCRSQCFISYKLPWKMNRNGKYMKWIGIELMNFAFMFDNEVKKWMLFLRWFSTWIISSNKLNTTEITIQLLYFLFWPEDILMKKIKTVFTFRLWVYNYRFSTNITII